MDPIAKKLSGTGVALVTPFHKNGAVDFDALTRLVNHILKGKCEYLVVLGTTGESVTLSTDEKTKEEFWVANASTTSSSKLAWV